MSRRIINSHIAHWCGAALSVFNTVQRGYRRLLSKHSTNVNRPDKRCLSFEDSPELCFAFFVQITQSPHQSMRNIFSGTRFDMILTRFDFRRWRGYVIWAWMGTQWRRCRGTSAAIRSLLARITDTSPFGMLASINRWVQRFVQLGGRLPRLFVKIESTSRVFFGSASVVRNV